VHPVQGRSEKKEKGSRTASPAHRKGRPALAFGKQQPNEKKLTLALDNPLLHPRRAACRHRRRHKDLKLAVTMNLRDQLGDPTKPSARRQTRSSSSTSMKFLKGGNTNTRFKFDGD